MKAGEIYSKLNDHFKLKGLTKEELLPFYQKLREYNYDEPHIFEKLGITDVDDIDLRYLPAYLEFNLGANDPLDRLLKIYLFARQVEEKELLEILGEDIISVLLRRGLLEKTDDKVSSPVALFPCLGYILATDHMFTRSYVSRTVYPLGVDSYALARVMMDIEADEALDLCTGCGVHALIASKTSKKVTGIDKNPRAVNFAKFNALLNQVDNAEFLQGDMYEPVAGRKFNWIIANPPFVPSPDEKLYFRHGSQSGERLFSQVVSGLDEHLENGGYAQIVHSMVFHKNEKYEDKIRGWLSSPSMQLLIFGTRFGRVEPYILNHVTVPAYDPGYNDELLKWVRSYKEQEITKIGDGLSFIKKTPESKPVTLFANIRMPLEKSDINPASILDLMEKRSLEDFRESLNDMIFRIADRVDFFWDGTQSDGSKKYGVLFNNSSVLMNEVLDIFTIIILDIITANPRKGSEIRTIFEKAAGHHPLYNDKLFTDKLLDLMVDGIITTD
ncbi:MAG: methyltransferase [Firmicutes bacterium]|nr:methyltransferase [Bacillota bacterium]